MPQPLRTYAAWQDAPTRVLGVVPGRPGVAQWQPNRADVDRMTRTVAAVLAGAFLLILVITVAVAAGASASSGRPTGASSTFDEYNRCVRHGYSSDGYVYVECVDEDYVIGYTPSVARAIAPKIVGYLPVRLR